MLVRSYNDCGLLCVCVCVVAVVAAENGPGPPDGTSLRSSSLLFHPAFVLPQRREMRSYAVVRRHG